MSLTPTPLSLPTNLSRSAMIKAIFNAQHPEEIIKSLPTQTIFSLIHHAGIESSTDIISLVTTKQYKLLLDFELWQKDTFSESSFWRWLSCIDEAQSLTPLGKFFSAVDTRLIGLLVLRYVESEFSEEPSEQPPESGFYTPDHGHTWLRIKCENTDNHNLLAKLLAYIFETDPDLFYKLLCTSHVGTSYELEEECYIDKTRRLTAEGIPDLETSWKTHKGINASKLINSIQQKLEADSIPSITAISPIVHDGLMPHPLREVVDNLMASQDLIERNEFEQIVTWIINTGIIRFGIPMNEWKDVTLLIQKIRGAINIGLELCTNKASMTPESAYSTYGATKLYQFGLYEIFGAQSRARSFIKKYNSKATDISDVSLHIASLIEKVSNDFPEFPEFLKHYAKYGELQSPLITTSCPFEHLYELETCLELIDEYFG